MGLYGSENEAGMQEPETAGVRLIDRKEFYRMIQDCQLPPFGLMVGLHHSQQFIEDSVDYCIVQNIFDL